MGKLKVKKNNKVILFNGSYGTIINIDYNSYQIEITGEHTFPQWFHISNIKFLNGINVENEELELE